MSAMSDLAMRSAAKAHEADCRMYREAAFDEIDRASLLLGREDYCGAADALYEAITDVHKASLMGEVGLTYEKCAGWREEDGDRDAD